MSYGLRQLFAACLAFVFIVSNLQSGAWAQTAPAQGDGVHLDLSSTNASVSASNAGSFSSAQINVGGTTRNVDPSSMLTPAEFVALQQILATGSQTLNLSTQGHATGGTFSTSAMSAQLASLLVPQGVTAVHDAGVLGALNLTGNLTNAGNLYAISSNAAVTNATFAAANIFNQQGALLSSVLPTNGLPGFTSAVANLNLTLSALNDIINSGRITSAGNLNVSAGGSIVNALPAGATGSSPVMQALNNINLTTSSLVNSGTIAAQLGNLNIASHTSQSVAQNINVNNNAGILSALNGAINLQADQAIATISGGRLDGMLNIQANESHVTVDSGTLKIGEAKLDGDPTFINSTGGIEITNTIAAFQSLAILANGDITASGPARIILNSTTSTGFNLIMVAGAAIDPNGNTNSSTIPPEIQTSSDVTVDFTSGNGGNIDLRGSFYSSSPLIDTSGSTLSTDAAGGNVTLAARANGTTGGAVFLPLTNFSPIIYTAGRGTGSDGDVTIIAGAATGTGIEFPLPSIVTSAGSTGGGGSVTLVSAAPTGSAGSSITVKPDGTIANGETIISGAARSGQIRVGAITAKGSINIATNSSILTANLETSGTIDVQAEGNVDTGSITSSLGSVFIRGNNIRTDAPGSLLDITSGPGTGITIIAAGSVTVRDLMSSDTAAGTNILVAAGGQIQAGGVLAKGTNFGGAINMISGGSLLSGTLDSSSFVFGGNILAVSGVDYTWDGATVTITNASMTGGSINVVDDIVATSTVASGGNVSLVSFKGTISVVGPINTFGSNNGNVLVVAGSTSAGNTVTLGESVTTASASTAPGGAVSIGATTPLVNDGDGFPVTVNGSSGVVTGTFGLTPTAIQPGAISMKAVTTNGGTLTVLAGGDINNNNNDFNTSRVLGAGNGGAITLVSLNGTIDTAGGTGKILSNGQSGNGGNILIAAGGSVITAALNSTAFIGSGAGGNINVVSGGDFLILDDGSVDAPGFGSNGGNIMLVAGANFSYDGTTVQVTGESTSGGLISIPGSSGGVFSNVNSGGDFSGGNISLVAYEGTTGSTASGTITIGNGGGGIGIDAGGNGTGNNGNITVVAGDNDNPTSISVSGSIFTDSGMGTSGDVTIGTTTPVVVGGFPVTITASSGAVNKTFSIDSDNVQPASVSLRAVGTNGGDVLIVSGDDVTLVGTGIFTNGNAGSTAASGTGATGANGRAGGNISIQAAGTISLQDLVSFGGGGGGGGGAGSAFQAGGDGGAGGAGGSISLFSSGGNVTISGFINASGGGGGGGGGGFASATDGSPRGEGGFAGIGGAVSLVSQSGSVAVNGEINTAAGGGGRAGGAGVAGTQAGGGGGGGGSFGSGGRGGTRGVNDGVTAGTDGNVGTNTGTGGTGGVAGGQNGEDAGSRNGNGSLFIAAGANIILPVAATTINVGSITLASFSAFSFARSFITPGRPITLVSSGNITAAADNLIIDSSHDEGGGEITLIAGANFTSNASGITITGASAVGSINLFPNPGADVIEIDAQGLAGDANGANVNLIAYSGQVLAQPTEVCTCGAGSGNNGNLTIIASGLISLPLIDTAMGGGAGGGISVSNAQTEFSSGTSLTIDSSGSITSGNFFVAGTLTASTIIATADIVSAGTIDFRSGDLVSLQGMTITVENGAAVNISAPHIRVVSSAQITASGPSVIALKTSDFVSNLRLELADGTFSTTGGFFLIDGLNGNITFENFSIQTANFNGGLLNISGLGNITIDSNVTLASNDAIFVNMNNTLIDQLFTLNGTLQSSKSGGDSITIQNLISNFALAGTGTIKQTGATPGNTVFNDFTRVIFTDGTNLTITSDNPGSNTSFFTQNLQVTRATPGAASATVTVTNNDNIFFGSCLPCAGGNAHVAFEAGGAATSVTLNLLGAPFSTVAEGDGGPVGNITVGTNFNLATNNNIIFNTQSGALAFNGTVATTSPTGTIDVFGLTGLSNITGGGSLTAPGGINFVTGDVPYVGFNTSGLDLNGPVTIDSCPGIVSVGNGATVNYSNTLTIETCTIFNINGFVGSSAPVVNICVDCPDTPFNPGGGTIANSDGDVVLTSGLVVNTNGKDLAIIAGGNVTAQGGVTINLSNRIGNGGNLLILAGTHIEPATPGQVKDSTTAFIVEGDSHSGGSVELTRVSVNTSSSFAGGVGGNVTIGAYAGPFNPGTVSIGSINTSAPTGTAGNVILSGEGGVTVNGSITATGGIEGGDVTLVGAGPDMPSAVGIVNGNVFGEILPGCFSCGSLNFVNVTGSINTSSPRGLGGNVDLEADRLVNVGGSITTSGGGGCCASGGVQVMTNGGAFTVGGSLNLNGFGVSSTTSTDDAGDGGDLMIFGTGFVQVRGNIVTSGGFNNGNGNGGNGGDILLLGNPTAGDNNFSIGSFVVRGYIDMTGGNSRLGTGGDGGALEVSIGRFAVGGTKGAVSINASGGTGVTPGAGGGIGIQTFAVQPLPTSFNATSATLSEIALPGGMFAIGDGTVNGARGMIVSNSSIVDKNNGSRIIGNQIVGDIDLSTVGTPITIQQGAGTKLISPDNGPGTARNRLTSGQALAAFQVSRDYNPGIQTIGLSSAGLVSDTSPNGGGFSRMTVDFFEWNSPTLMTAFNLATVGSNKLTVTTVGPGAYLNLSSATLLNVGGTLDFQTDLAQIEVGARAFFVAQSGNILQADPGALFLSGTSPRWTNNGAIRANYLRVLHPTTALTLTMGQGATFGGLDTFLGEVDIQAPSFAMTGGQVVATDLGIRSAGNSGTVNLQSAFAADARIDSIGQFRTIIIAPTAGTPIRIRIGAELNATGNILIQSNQNITIDKSGSLTSGGTISLVSNFGTLSIGLSEEIMAAGNIALQGSNGVLLNDNVLVRAGALKPNTPPVGVLTTTQIQSRGSLQIVSAGGPILIREGTSLISTGNNLGVVASNNSLTLQNDISVRADGGNMFLRGGTTLTGGTGNTFYARAVGTTGGGIELAAGPFSSDQIAQAFQQPSGTSVSPALLGSNVEINNGLGTLGVVQLQTSGGGTVNLSVNNEQATLNLLRGVQVFQSLGAGAVLQMEGATITTEALRPIAYHVPTAPNISAIFGENFWNPTEDMTIETQHANIQIRKNALVVIQSDRDSVRVFACSGPGDVKVKAGAKTIQLAPGQELVIANRHLTEDELSLSDGVGRRESRTYHIADSTFATVTEFSLVSLIRNSEHLAVLRQSDTTEKRAVLARMAKTAAILHQLSAQKGPYRAKMPHKRIDSNQLRLVKASL